MRLEGKVALVGSSIKRLVEYTTDEWNLIVLSALTGNVASDESGFVTGSILTADGGYTINGGRATDD
jgi:hypothetical protein